MSASLFTPFLKFVKIYVFEAPGWGGKNYFLMDKFIGN